MKILDATCGKKEMWFQKNHPLVTFMDKRYGKYFYQYPNSPKKEIYDIKPDVVSEWKDAPFPDDYFDLIIFDPPHIIQNSEKGSLPIKYTVLKPGTWNNILKNGIEKLFKILKPEGIFIFKWNECSKDVEDVIKLCPYKPLFGTRTGLNNKNIWLVFLKYDVNMKLTELHT